MTNLIIITVLILGASFKIVFFIWLFVVSNAKDIDDWEFEEDNNAYINSLEVNEPNELKATETHNIFGKEEDVG